jgi:hypothetical protein
MRPVYRGNTPANPITSEEIIFRHYKEAKPYLVERIGCYCSFCEKRLTQLLEVEHILPKSLNPELEFAWDNFLLSCKTCNTIKGKTETNRNDFYWVDCDNTFLAFDYSSNSSEVLISENLTDEQKAIALRTLDLIGLNRRLGDPKLTPADTRWRERLDIWGIAQESLKDLQANDTENMRRQIVRTALGHGFWSIWMTVFKDDPDMLQRFIDAFAGTCRDCFDADGKPIPRLGGNL